MHRLRHDLDIAKLAVDIGLQQLPRFDMTARRSSSDQIGAAAHC
jgi:hypothetical protein